MQRVAWAFSIKTLEPRASTLHFRCCSWHLNHLIMGRTLSSMIDWQANASWWKSNIRWQLACLSLGLVPLYSPEMPTGSPDTEFEIDNSLDWTIIPNRQNKLRKPLGYINYMTFRMSSAFFIRLRFLCSHTFERFIMLFSQPFLLLLGAYCSFVTAGPLDKRAAPTVTLDTATVTGVASGAVNKWLGIPFALPP